MSRIDLSLYLVTDPRARFGVVETVRMAAENGATIIQLRDKQADDATLIAQAKTLKEILKPLNIPLIINDRIDVAIAARADGLHIGQSDGDVQAARARLGPDAILGLSIEALSQLDKVSGLDVDYFGVGPVLATATKQDHSEPTGFDGLARIIAQAEKDCVAIGGLKQQHLRAVFRAGAKGAAVVSAITMAKNPAEATKALRQEWENAAL
jgi:thiamine-phosphate pyrophosphorylase